MKRLLIAIGCIFAISKLFSLSLSEDAYEKMSKNIICHQIVVENNTGQALRIDKKVILPDQTAVVHTQCLSEYDRLSTSLGMTPQVGIQPRIKTTYEQKTLINIPNGLLERDYLFSISIEGGKLAVKEKNKPQEIQQYFAEPVAQESIDDLVIIPASEL